MGYEVVAGSIFAATLFYLSIHENVNQDPDGQTLRFNKRWRKLLFYMGWLQMIFTFGTAALTDPVPMIVANIFMYVIFFSFMMTFNLIGWLYGLFERLRSR